MRSVDEEIVNDESGGLWASGMGLLALVTGAALIILVVIWLTGIAFQQIHAPVNAESLHDSVGVATGAGIHDRDDGKCWKPGGESWTCEIIEYGGSSVHDYRVNVSPGSSCWRAQPIGPGVGDGFGPERKPISACVHHFEGGWSNAIGL
jgi:hypothetical protein